MFNTIKEFIANHDMEVIMILAIIISIIAGIILYNTVGQTSNTLDIVEWVANPANPASPLY